MVWEEMSFEEFQDGCCGGNLKNSNGTVLALINLHKSKKEHVFPVPPTKFQLNLTYRSGANTFQHFQDDHHGSTPWVQKDFSNSKPPSHPNASHQVWAQST